MSKEKKIDVEGFLKVEEDYDVVDIKITRMVESGGINGEIKYPLLEKLKELDGQMVKIIVEVVG